MIGYNPSHLNKNETLLEAFHRVEAYLKANPQYQVFQSSATYQEGAQEYALNTIVVPEGSSVGKGDVVLFSNVYYAVITAVSETTFSVKTATNFRGTTGATGANGTDGKDGVTPNISMNATVDNNVGVPEVEVTKSGTNENPSFTLGFHNIKGTTGNKGETGLPALMYSKGVVTGPYQSFGTDLDGYNRTPQINDSCVYISTNNDYLILGTIQQVFSDTQRVDVNKVFSIDIQGRDGDRGPQGVNGRDGKDGISTLLYAGELSESVTTAEIAQVTMPTDRAIQVYDILISTSPNTFGAMSQVTGLGQTTATVNFIGTLQSEGGSGASDYNDLANIPVINQDLSASGFTPVANTYYRHTGATTDTFTQGVIYLYDTAYHKLGESGGGGTTLNRYTVDDLYSPTKNQMKLLCKIIKESKGKVMLSFKNYGNMPASCIYGDNNDINVFISSVGISIDNTYKTTIMLTINSSTGEVKYGSIERFKYVDNTRTVEQFTGLIRCIYFNDTEITL